MPSTQTSANAAASVIEGIGLRAVYQPIVDLATEAVVGYEALARGPVGSPLEMPIDLFAAARAEGRQGELDRACRKVAIEGAIAGGLGAEDLLFINVEPDGLDAGGVLDRLADHHLESVQVVVEFTERTLTARPAEVLAAVRWLRERNCRIALDDVGVDRRSLALMPFLVPDVIKLDLSITQEAQDPLVAARVLNAVGAEVERRARC
jgi:EAL domain-containing protein (putative c-di-GMP-specific phosphodiesterase class I)